MKIYLDDERNPTTDKDWIIVRNYDELTRLILLDKFEETIDEISFDHDLGCEFKNGLDCVKFLVETDQLESGNLLSKDFKYNFHTANPCGRDNMKSYIESYLKTKQED